MIKTQLDYIMKNISKSIYLEYKYEIPDHKIGQLKNQFLL